MLISQDFFAQNQDSIKKKIRFHTFNLGVWGLNDGLKMSEVQKFSSTSPLVTKDYSEFSLDAPTEYDIYRIVLTLEKGISLGKREETKCFSLPNLMFGLNYFGDSRALSITHDETIATDTLISGSGQTYYYKDQLAEQYSFRKKLHNIGLSAAYRIDLFPQNYVINFSMGFSSEIDFNFSHKLLIEHKLSNYESLNESNSFIKSIETENTKLKAGNFIYSTNSLILGLSFNFKKFPDYRFFYECKPTLAIFYSKDKGNVFSSFYRHSFGVRFDIWKFQPVAEEDFE